MRRGREEGVRLISPRYEYHHAPTTRGVEGKHQPLTEAPVLRQSSVKLKINRFTAGHTPESLDTCKMSALYFILLSYHHIHHMVEIIRK